MSVEQILGVIIGVVVTVSVRFLADRFPTPQARKRMELENRRLEAEIEQLERQNEEEK